MRSGGIGGTRWFAMSGRELTVLAVMCGLILAAIGLGRVARLVWGRGGVDAIENSDVVAPPARLDVNTAAEYELEMLPGIGPKTARAIVEYRAEHGPFGSLEELVQVKGIGPQTIERIRPHAMCAPLRARTEQAVRSAEK